MRRAAGGMNAPDPSWVRGHGWKAARQSDRRGAPGPWPGDSRALVIRFPRTTVPVHRPERALAMDAGGPVGLAVSGTRLLRPGWMVIGPAVHPATRTTGSAGRRDRAPLMGTCRRAGRSTRGGAWLPAVRPCVRRCTRSALLRGRSSRFIVTKPPGDHRVRAGRSRGRSQGAAGSALKRPVLRLPRPAAPGRGPRPVAGRSGYGSGRARPGARPAGRARCRAAG